MKILLVSRGSQGDVYPYLRLAVELKNRGHRITLSVPRLFEKQAQAAGVSYVLQASDDIHGMLEDAPDTRNLLEWTRRIIDSQFREYISLLRQHDILVASNTEFAAGSVAEFCGKPLIRTAFGPFIPSRIIPPPVFPWPKPHPVFTPAFLWSLLNAGLNLMVKKPLNKNRKLLGLPPVKDQSKHAPASADNFLLYSTYLGAVDNAWKYRWKIGGYLFNDILAYNQAELEKIINFIKQDKRPVVFFSLGSCNIKQRDRFAELLYSICIAHGYKLIVACGWWNVGARLNTTGNLLRMESVIPHYLIFPHCDAIIHHGGVGSTHSAARSGKPQMVVPLLLDQFYWARQVQELGIGPGGVNIKSGSRKQLELKVLDLVNNSAYKEKARSIGDLVRSEQGLENFCEYIETYQVQSEAEREGA